MLILQQNKTDWKYSLKLFTRYHASDFPDEYWNYYQTRVKPEAALETL